MSVRNGKDFIRTEAAIRDSSSKVVVAISKPMVGKPSIELGDLMALRESLLLAKRNNLDVTTAAVDTLSVASMINSNIPALGDAMFLVSDIKSLCIEVGGCECKAIPRLSNGLAHGLANLAFSSGEEIIWRDTNLACLFPGL